MIAALIQGILVSDPTAHPADPPRRGAMVRLLVRTSTGADTSALVSAVAFQADLIARLQPLRRGDHIALTGTLKPSTYQKNGATEHGLDLTITGVLTPYDVRQRRKAPAPVPAPQEPDNTWNSAFE